MKHVTWHVFEKVIKSVTLLEGWLGPEGKVWVAEFHDQEAAQCCPLVCTNTFIPH